MASAPDWYRNSMQLRVRIPSLRRMTPRLFSTLAAQGVGMLGTILLLFLLNDNDVVFIVAALSLTGVISGAVASNNTSKIYAYLSEERRLDEVARLSIRLFIFEQTYAIALAAIVPFFPIAVLAPFNPVEIYFLAVISSCSSLIAFCKYDDKVFVAFNYLRIFSTLCRVLGLLLLAHYGWTSWFTTIITVTLFLPYAFAIRITLNKCNSPDTHSPLAPHHQPDLLRVIVREYLLGTPSAISRSIVNQGLFIAAAESLSSDDLRLFRFLLLPKELVGRLFNMILPLIFDSAYSYRLNWRHLAFLGLGSSCSALIWFAVGAKLFVTDLSVIPSFVCFMVLNLSVYAVLPTAWRSIYLNRAYLNTLVVITASVVPLLFLPLVALSNIEGFLMLINVYLAIYLLGMMIISFFGKNTKT